MSTYFYGLMTLVALVLAVTFAAVATVYVNRLERRTTAPVSEQVGSAKAVLRKVRKGEPMSHDEADYAKRLVGDRGSLLTLCIPAALFMLGGFYVFGSLYHLHGATPSERTFLGVLPMLTSMNLAIQIRRHARLKRRLKNLA